MARMWICDMYYVSTADVEGNQIEAMQELLEQAQVKQRSLVQSFRTVDQFGQNLNISYQEAQKCINQTAISLQAMVDDIRVQTSQQLTDVYNTKQVSLSLMDKKMQNMMEKLAQTIQFTGRLLEHATSAEILVFKKLLETRLQAILNYSPEFNLESFVDIEFLPDMNSARKSITTSFGHLRHGNELSQTNTTPGSAGSKTTGTPATGPIGSRPASAAAAFLSGGNHLSGNQNSNSVSALARLQNEASLLSNDDGANSSMLSSLLHNTLNNSGGGVAGRRQFFSGSDVKMPSSAATGAGLPSVLGMLSKNNDILDNMLVAGGGNGGGDNMATPRRAVAAAQVQTQSSQLDPTSAPYVPAVSRRSVSGMNVGPNNLAAMAAAGTTFGIVDAGDVASLSMDPNGHAAQQQQVIDLTSAGGGTHGGGYGGGNADSPPSIFPYPPKSHIKRSKMTYHCKFGEFGVMEGQFTEPSGVTVNLASGDIIVADTNNHRIQVFDREGRFSFAFGECGKRDGQLLYPNRVAVNRTTGDIIVTERSPTHQVQIYNQYGQFLRKFGATVLQHPRGVCVDHKSRIVIVECKVMRVLIFDMFGNVLQKFSCSRYLEFPNGVITNDRQEIFISDNRAHCVKVFSYDGSFLRQVGGEGITNYPIGVGINASGQVVVADNHNNFNLTVFTQDGTLVNALESKVKHAQCFDVALQNDGSVVLASKDYRLYIYRYIQMGPASGGFNTMSPTTVVGTPIVGTPTLSAIPGGDVIVAPGLI